MQKHLNLNLKKSDFYLLAIFISLVLAIIFKSMFHPEGYLTPDSRAYLELAENLLKGNGYFIDGNLFSHWPVGYPTLIAIIAKLFSIDVYIASKLLNITLIAFCFLLLRSQFGSYAFLYATVFLFSSFIEIFALTWSEAPFIFGILWFFNALTEFHEKIQWASMLNIFLSVCFLFTIRYSGAFTGLCVFVLALTYLRNQDGKRALRLAFVGISAFIVMISYLSVNHYYTGYIAGMPRLAVSTPIIAPLKGVFLALIEELNLLFKPLLRLHRTHLQTIAIICFPIFIVIELIILYPLLKVRKTLQKINTSALKIPLLIGLTYILCIFSLSFISAFDPLDYRLLGPGTFLILIALITFMRSQDPLIQRKFERCLFRLVILSYVINVPIRIVAVHFLL